MSVKNGASHARKNGRATEFSVNANGGSCVMEVTITGISPMLQNAMPRDVLLALYTKDKPAKTAERPDPMELAASKVWRLPNGNPCIPQRMLIAAIMAAGQFVRLDGKRQVSSATSTQLPRLVTLLTPELPLLKPGTNEPAEWAVDIQQGRNPNGGEAVCIIRPCFFQWETHFSMIVNRKTFPVESARELLSLAGTSAGLGDFRPNRKGTFGMFAITKWTMKSTVPSALDITFND